MKRDTYTNRSNNHIELNDNDDDILDLDEEDLEDSVDFDRKEYAEDDYEDEWEPEWKDIVNKKLLYGVAAVVVLVLIVLIIVFAVFLKNKKDEREALQMQLDMENVEEPQPSENDVSDDTEPEQNVQPEEPDLEKDINDSENVEVGALDDEQDPQANAAAGNEGSGAEVTVTGISDDEVSGVTMGIDVSKYQGNINWGKVKASGVEFAMIRVGYRAKTTGEIFEDPTARYNMQEAQNAGIMIGAYFFSSAVTQEEARAEASFTKNIIAKYKITYPVAYNCEDFQSPDSRQYGLDSSTRTALACAYLDEIASGGYTPMFYASKGELEGNAQWDTTTLASKYKIWVAQYPGKPYPETNASEYSGTHDMWQYTSQGNVDGIPRKTDVNIAYFKYTKEADAKDDTPAEVVEANPEVGIIFTEVNETVTAKQETNLRSEPSTNSDDTIVYKLVHGDTATRTGIGHNGWSRVIYNGQTLYAVTSYLTTDMADTGQQAPPQGPVYTPVNEQVTAKIETNLRTEPSTANPDTVVGMLHNGEVLTRVGIGDNGWSQLEYNGQTVYAVSSYLTVQP
ncbi:MAG: glycoside hydrolase family 25 [Lachnospiraceae bacterium]|nr:glycoside hydrolase family 25 [Lachnospiraceae bacterium]